jgi:hypothetical protein
MNLDKFLENPGQEKHSLDIGLAIIRVLQLSNLNKVYLEKILKNQFELRELLHGKTGSEIDDIVEKKFNETQSEIINIANQNYLEMLGGILNQDK